MARPDTRSGGPPGGLAHPPDRRRSSTPSPPSAEVRPSGILPSPADVSRLLDLSDERDLWLRRVLDAWREGYQAALSDAVVASLLRIWPQSGHVPEIDKRRYPPDGRRSWIIPRPGEDGEQR